MFKVKNLFKLTIVKKEQIVGLQLTIICATNRFVYEMFKKDSEPTSWCLQILSFEKLKSDKVWHFFFKNNNWCIIEIVAG